jgi:hypothetical protein
VLAGINLFFIVTLLREKRVDRGYTVLAVDEDDTYLQHFLTVHGRDIATYFPRFAGASTGTAYLVLHGDETAGVTVIRPIGDGQAQVELDYVTPRFRDLTPGEFVWRRSGLLREAGLRRVYTTPGMRAPYYGRLGFVRDGERYRIDVAER